MVKSILTPALVVVITCVAYAQDTLWTTNGPRLTGNIAKMLPGQIVIKTNQGKRKIPISNVDLVLYEDGYLHRMRADADLQYAQRLYDSLYSENAPIDSQAYHMGVHDALMQYHKYKKGQYLTGTITANLGPVIGLIPALSFSYAKYRPAQLGVTDLNLFVNKSYKLGYLQTCQNMRRKGIWKSYGIGTATGAASFGIISLALWLQRINRR